MTPDARGEAFAGPPVRAGGLETAGPIACARVAFDGPARWRVEDALRVGESFRRAFMARCGQFEPLPSEVSGHEGNRPARGHRHAYFLPEDADGDGWIDHLILYLPGGFSVPARHALTQIRDVWPLGLDVRVERFAERAALAAISGLMRPSTVWISATPYLHPWHCKKHGRFGPAEQLQREIDLAGLPPVLRITPRDQVHAGSRSVDASAFQRTRTKKDRHAPDHRGSLWELVFPEPVLGPLSFGLHAHIGLGLFRTAQAEDGNL